MSFGDAIQRRADLLRKRGSNVELALLSTSRGATMRAAATAQDRTPMTADDLAGVGTRSGGLKQRWATDSKPEPVLRPVPGGQEYATELRNDAQYASYVDQGHRMDRHFVPGLMVNPGTGRLERVDPALGGIMVGTKTKYVPGVFMSEAGVDAFKDSSVRELGRIAREVFKP